MEILFVIFVLSGTIKAIFPLIGIFVPIDITAVTVLLIIFNLFLKKNRLKYISVSEYYLIGILFIFYSLMVLSLNYTSSDNYGYIKTLYFLTMILAFIFPIVIKSIDIDKFMDYFTIIVFLMTFIFFKFYYQYLSGQLHTVLNKEQIVSATGLYLTLSGLLSLITLYYYFSNEKSKKTYMLFLISLILMIATGGRGPLLFSVIIIFFNLMYRLFKVILNLKVKKNIFYTIPIIIVGLVFVTLFLVNYNESLGNIDVLFEHSFNRFMVMFESDNGGDSINSRFKYIKFALEHINEYPFFGYGIGSFGYEYTGFDHRDYPHNIFIETWFELGLVPFLLLMVFLYIIVLILVREKRYAGLAIIIALLLNTLKSSSLVDIRSLLAFAGMFIVSYTSIKKNKEKNEKNSKYSI